MLTTTDTIVKVGKCASTGEDISLSYDTFGNSKDPCLLLVVGLAGVGRVWRDAFCEMIAKKGFYVVRYDNRDVGLSTHLDNQPTPNVMQCLLPQFLSFLRKVPYTLEDMAADGMNLLTALGIERAHVVGSSMGGMIAQIMAIKYPSRVRSLGIIYSHTGSSKRVPETFSTKLLFMKKPKSSALEDVVDFKCALARHFRGPGYNVDEEEFRKLAKEQLERANDYPQGMLRQLAAILSAKSREECLKTITIPTLIIHGMLDEVVPYQNGLQIAEAVGPAAKLVIYPRMGHEIPVELMPSISQEIADNCGRELTLA
ncbi:hydrolase, alpha/beta fold family, putative [Trypanosoma equiperdum]|uniref:Hydrolase, alpha/beta fold family, putative n=2 Tax=Trypanozoon TaxID=39700 RepID=Q582C7_TRYB2|nr:hydrolase, alpha/beta fold family, putative [Trypanosoma brucei brucei TREU927]AAX80442.1 hydrolase, alpha/beta fold family, putative [Trypanosoma brucei]AAZ11353.1 hydrolase, alpha/beta fold family, putative [Trypanosoma brucei brucei TREU927]SCU70321.1 hydrolase, alpha/beta fold family, putative [Trypanosoma equiperdum]